MISRSITMIQLTSGLFIFTVFVVINLKNCVDGSPKILEIFEDFRTNFDPSIYNEDADLLPTQLIKKYGYHGEIHNVITKDGYILELHRITGSKRNPNPRNKQPILLMHGLLCSSVDWVITGPDRAFGYILADEGYDVWMGNTRGNTFSRKHRKHSTLDDEYWQFSWHEIGFNDLPAMIDYVLEKTNKSQLIYAGHSQATTTFWVMASELPDYQNKVKAMFALAPVAYLNHVRSIFYQVLAPFSKNIEKMMHLIGWNEFEPSSELLRELISIICDEDAFLQPFCTNIIFLVSGFGSDQLNTTMLTAILGHVPAGASVKQIAHYAQLIKARNFQQYDHGIVQNWKKYKSLRPPIYDLSKIKVPVSLHYSSNDWIADPRDVDRLYRELGNPIGKFRVPHEEFGHIDFVWAKDGKQLLYEKIVGLMQKYKD